MARQRTVKLSKLRSTLAEMHAIVKNQVKNLEKDPTIPIAKKAIMKDAYYCRLDALEYALSQVDVFELVDAFHHKFELQYKGSPRQLPPDLEQFRINFLEEEMHEIKVAADNGNLADFVDGLVDLIYVAAGTMLMCMDVNRARACFLQVQQANMSKERCLREEDSKRGSTYDVIKPEGWKPPNYDDILKGFIVAVEDKPDETEETT